jgi:drug/metabolite transporter (DMT)-like permease
LLAGVVTGELPRFHPGSVSMLSLGSFVYLVIIGAVVGYTAYIWLLRHCDPAKVATYAYVNPIVAVLLGTFFAGETVTARTLVAATSARRAGLERCDGTCRLNAETDQGAAVSSPPH